MRPIILTMTAFGPYADKEVVDFRDAVASGLFGIYGSTGSGKSTIFSAITFALFGEASRSDQDTTSLRSHHAADDVLTRVDFIFEIGSARYLIRRTPDQMRPALRGEGETKDVHKAWLFDVTGIDPDDITETNCGKIIAEKKVSHVKVAVFERLGYGAEQFRQIVLLPQGKFEIFLTAKTDERMKILRDLFDVSLYRKLAQTLKDQAKAAEDAVVIDRRTCVRQLEQEGFESPDALKIGITEAQVEQDKAEKVAGAAVKAAGLAAKSKSDAEQLESTFLSSETAQAELLKLTQQSEAMRVAEIKRKNATKAQSMLDLDTAQVAAKVKLATAQTELVSAMTHQGRAAAQKDEASQRLKAQDALSEKREDQRRRVDALAQYTATFTKAKALKAALNTATSKQSVSQSSYEQAETQQKEVASKHAEAQRLAKASHTNALARSQLNTDITKAQQSLAAAKTYADSNRLCTEAKALAAEAVNGHAASQKQLSEAQVDFDQAESDLAAAQAQHLAEKLVDGEACAVCGSETHPFPAGGHAESAGLDKAFRDARNAIDGKRVLHVNTAQAMSAAKAKADDRKVHLGTLSKPNQTLEVVQMKFDGLNDKLKALGPETQTAEFDANIARLASQFTDTQSTITKARANLDQAKTEAALAKQAYESALRSIPEPLRSETALAAGSQSAATTLKSMFEAFKSAQENDKQAQDASLSSAKDSESAEKIVTAAKSSMQQASDTFLNRLQQQGFSIEAFEDHKANIDRIDAMTSVISVFKEQLAIAQDRAKTTAMVVKDKVRPDLAALHQAGLEAEAARTAETGKAAAIKAKALQLEALLKSISTEMARIEKVELETSDLRELAALFNANNAARLDLETFAIGAMFDRVLQAANLRLQPMTSRRYSLERELEGKGGGRRGLGICVHDIHTGKARATSTLSGGETFIAALSLALGLSDIVETVSGNIRLDTIFIDEGFGSLDTDNDTGTLDQVLQTLQDLVGDNRVVGLISHVQLVQHAIPNGFTIKKTATGSHVEARSL